jgi:signal transduction histidine kinase
LSGNQSSLGFDAFTADDLELTQSFISKRIDALSARVLSLATLGTGIEMFLVYLSQAKTLNTTASTVFIALVLTAELALVLFSLFTQFGKVAAGIFAVIVFFTLCTWPMQIFGTQQAENPPTPWVYEALGVAGIAATLSLPVGWAIAYVVVTPVIWVVIRESTSASQFQHWDSLLGAIYVLLFSSSVSAIVVLLRNSAKRADLAGQQAAQVAAQSARIDAIERERSRVDALVHDQVLTTLIVASQAKTETDSKSVTAMSQNAIDKLMTFSSTQLGDDSPITVKSLFESLKSIAENVPAPILVDMGDTTDVEVPSEVAAAFSEATIQALANSVQHAGRGVTREVILRVDGQEVKVVVQDNGKGFRASRVSKDRLGIKLSIRDRMHSVGGKAKVDTLPNKGCKIILIWSQA